METRNILDHSGNTIGQLQLPEGTSESAWTEQLELYLRFPAEPTLSDLVRNAIVFGEDLMADFSAENIILGIVASGKTLALMDYLLRLQQILQTGSLYVAISQLDLYIADSSSEKTLLDPFITNTRLSDYKHRIQDYLGIPRT